jgi:hypothetical protein
MSIKIRRLEHGDARVRSEVVVWDFEYGDD